MGTTYPNYLTSNASVRTAGMLIRTLNRHLGHVNGKGGWIELEHLTSVCLIGLLAAAPTANGKWKPELNTLQLLDQLDLVALVEWCRKIHCNPKATKSMFFHRIRFFFDFWNYYKFWGYGVLLHPCVKNLCPILLINLSSINHTTTSTLYVANFAQNNYKNFMSYLE
jgi:hypothetical protein